EVGGIKSDFHITEQMDEFGSVTRRSRLIKPTQKYQEIEWMTVRGRGKRSHKGRGGSVVEMDARLVMKVAAYGFCGGGGRSEDLFWNQTLKVKILSENNSARCPFGYTIMEKGG
ncbi:unnamed protein product, partial [Brassica oleracea var. botrytis]